jgi:predicted transcriptional regulator
MIDFACKRIELEDLIRCSLNLSKSDFKLFNFLLTNDSFTVKSLSDKLDLDRTTIQKSVKKLLDRGILEQYQENLSPGGYRFIYKIKEKDQIKKKILSIIKNWTENVNKTIENW